MSERTIIPLPVQQQEATRRVLSLAVELHLDGMREWPGNQEAADQLGVTQAQVGQAIAALATAKSIRVWTVTKTRGNNIDGIEEVRVFTLMRPDDKFLNPAADFLQKSGESQ